MGTPVLSKVQSKLSLSGKKAKKQFIRNVVVNPQKTYWPLVKSEMETLTTVLKENLPRIKPVKINVPWRLLENTPRDERKSIRETFMKKHLPFEQIVKEDSLVFGVNEVTKLLESDLCCVVLVANMNPKIVVKHIMELVVIKNVPVLVLSNLKEILMDACGLQSMAFAIKKCFPDSSSNLENIRKIVTEIHKNYLPNVNENEESNMIQTQPNQNNPDKPVKKSLVNKDEAEKLKNYHLVRKSDGLPAYIPDFLEEEPKNGKTEKFYESLRFEYTSQCETQKSVNEFANRTMNKKMDKKHYKALVVKRLKGNKDRKNPENKEKKKLKKEKKKMLKKEKKKMLKKEKMLKKVILEGNMQNCMLEVKKETDLLEIKKETDLLKIKKETDFH